MVQEGHHYSIDVQEQVPDEDGGVRAVARPFHFLLRAVGAW